MKAGPFLKITLLLASIFYLSACQKSQEYEDFEVVETYSLSCEVDSDCKTPVDYLMRSSCPYESRCLKSHCAVVCPHPFNSPS